MVYEAHGRLPAGKRQLVHGIDGARLPVGQLVDGGVVEVSVVQEAAAPVVRLLHPKPEAVGIWFARYIG